jgi:hypothetical protein
MNYRSLVAFAFAGFLAGAPLAAEPPGTTTLPYPDAPDTAISRPTRPPEVNGYGTSDWTAMTISPMAFQPYSTALGLIYWSGGYVGPQNTDTYRWFSAPIHIPTGAQVGGLTAYFYDASVTGYVRIVLARDTCSGGPCAQETVIDQQTSTSEAPGYDAYYYPVTPFTWNNWNGGSVASAHIRVYFSAGTTDLRIGPATLWYKLQVSPPPATATFGDVPTSHWAFQYIEALTASGITAGTGGGNFSPDATLTRAQMAVFLSKALGLHWPN